MSAPTEPGWYWAKVRPQHGEAGDGNEWEVVLLLPRGRMKHAQVCRAVEPDKVWEQDVAEWGPRIPEPTEHEYTVTRKDLENAAAAGITIIPPAGMRLVVRD